MFKFFKKYKKKSPLRAKHVGFSYGEQDVLRDMSVNIKTNQIISIVGRSGEGKSTFLHLVVGVLTKKHKGKINILGLGKELAKEDIGFVPQHLSFINDLDLESNIEFFGNINGLKREKSLKRAEFLMDLFQLNIPLTKFPGELSGGQKVRLNIILSILHDPQILVLDEPFVGLDYYNRMLLWHFIENQKNRRKTIILTTHMLAEAEQNADRIILLHKGKVYAQGKPEDIRRKLKINYILEIKFQNLNKSKYEDLVMFCKKHDSRVVDKFKNYLMFSVKDEEGREDLLKYFKRQDLIFKELGFREPNLDEISLKVIEK